MKEAYGIMLTLNRGISRKRFVEEYRRIRWFIKEQEAQHAESTEIQSFPLSSINP